MLKTIDSVSNLLRATVTMVIVAAVGTGGWLGYRTWTDREDSLRNQEARLTALQNDLQQSQAEIARLNHENERLSTANRLLKIDRRVARLSVVDQWTEEGQLMTKVQFVELNPAGEPLHKPQDFVIEGDTVYIDAWVAKFEDAYVEQGVELKDKTIFLFRSLYGKNQKPADGFPLDPYGSLPFGYRQDGRDPSSLEKEIWSNFWQYANDNAKAESIGLRAAHGQANYVEKIRKGSVYRVLARASDGLSIVPERPAAPQG